MRTVTFVDTLMLYPFCRSKFSSFHQPLFSTNLETSRPHVSLCLTAGLLPWKIGKDVYCTRTLFVYENLENGLPFHWRQHQEKGDTSNSIMHVIFGWDVVGAYFECCSCVQIVFVENKKLKSTLVEEVEESQLPDIYGGQMPLVPIQDNWLNHTF